MLNNVFDQVKAQCIEQNIKAKDLGVWDSFGHNGLLSGGTTYKWIKNVNQQIV